MKRSSFLVETQASESFEVIDGIESDYDELPGLTPDTPTIAGSVLWGTTNLFSTLYDGHHDFETSSFIPGLRVGVTIVHVERFQSHPINPNLYEIEVTHGKFVWRVKRRYSHFVQLHNHLKWFAATARLPGLTKKHREARRSMKLSGKKSLPRFPRLPEYLVPRNQMEERKSQLESYLRDTLEIPAYRNNREMMNFLEVSPFSFIDQLGQKGREGLVQKRSGGRVSVPGCITFGNIFSDLGIWNRRWLIVKESYVMYIKPRDGSIRTVLLMDRGFRVEVNIHGSKRNVVVANSTRKLVLKCWTERRAHELASDIIGISRQPSAQSFIKGNRFESFAPSRSETLCKWIIDGSHHFRAVAEAIERASEEVFITGWWLSPEVYLRRPVIHGDLWRLDQLLLRKAAQGVRVFILLYKEVQMALGIGSFYSKSQLMKHANIKVLRHPDAVKGGTILWSHHEKTVVIDQCIAFVGGIDLCYGRWDTRDHRLTDLGGVTMTRPQSESNLIYSLEAPREETRPDRTLTLKLKRDPVPTAQSSGLKLVKFEQSRDFENNVTERPKPKTKGFKKFRRTAQMAVMLSKLRKKSIDSLEDFDPVAESITGQSSTREEVGAKLWFGKDYINFIVRDILEVERPFGDLVDRNTTPRMPWHDISCIVTGSVARDVARHFIERWNHVKLEKAKFHSKYPFLLPKTYSDFSSPQKYSFLAKLNSCDVQVVRSVSRWSIGTQTDEISIHNAYVDLIANSEHFIYIENQFFITSTGSSLPILNRIGKAIFDRIMKAFKEGNKFKAFLLLPLLPCFEGEVGRNSGTAIQAVTNWNLKSICRGNDSLIRMLQKAGIEDPSEYISFCGLRKWSILNGKLVTELIYVHSKLLIVDDRITVIGSSNINDRSMVGFRDSEVCVVINDHEFIPSVMDGKPFEVGRFSSSLRQNLMKEHLGMSEMTRLLQDPVNDELFFNNWIVVAERNTGIYEEVFGCIPTNEVTTFIELRNRAGRKFLATTDPKGAADLLREVKGHLVSFPFYFLKNENLEPAPNTKEFLVPSTVWT